MKPKSPRSLHDQAASNTPGSHASSRRKRNPAPEAAGKDPERADRERERLHAIAAAANTAHDLDEILLLIRNAIIEVEGFERAGVYLAENGVFHGSWGTDLQRNLSDEHHLILNPDQLLPQQISVLRGEKPYSLDTYAPVLWEGQQPDREVSVRDFVMIGLSARGEIIGLITADNLFSGSRITAPDVEAVLPFCEQVAVALSNMRLLAERERMVERQRRLMQIAAAINASQELDEVLRLVRDAIVGAGGFDRAAVFLLDREHNVLRGAWGTDRLGQAENLADQEVLVLEPADRTTLAQVARGEVEFALCENFEQAYQVLPGSPMSGVHAHAAVPLQIDGMVVGAVTVDNLLRDAPITPQDVQGLLPFANLAAVAIHNARLFSDLRQAQEALVRAEKLRAVGELASGVAHNVNNVLAAVLGYAELIQSSEGTSAEVQHYARTIERAAMDGAQIVRRMQQFARLKTETEKAPFDLATAVQEAVDLTRPTWHDQAIARGIVIQMKVHVAADLWVPGAASELREVIVNLITNAAHAMPEGGALTVRGYAEEGQAVLEVQDTGLGMSEEIRRRIFEPFFTTKGSGMGTGLGLSVAWGIINQHGGRIDVQSAPGEGSLFRIYLPLSGSRAGEESSGEGDTTLAGVRILLVEDQELVLTGLARRLTGRGATVALAMDGADALEWLNEHAADCDLIVSDHGMVGITGAELLSRVRERYPHIRRVLLSGWGADLPGRIDTSAVELLLTKPVQQQTLVAELAALIGKN